MSDMSISDERVRDILFNAEPPPGGGCFGGGRVAEAGTPQVSTPDGTGLDRWMVSSPDPNWLDRDRWMVSSPDPGWLDRNHGTDEDRVRRAIAPAGPGETASIKRAYEQRYGQGLGASAGGGGFWGRAGNALQSGLSTIGSWFGF